MSQVKYALHRGCSRGAVQKALGAGRITAEASGLIDSEKADREWERNTAPRLVAPSPPRIPGKRAQAKAPLVLYPERETQAAEVEFAMTVDSRAVELGKRLAERLKLGKAAREIVDEEVRAFIADLEHEGDRIFGPQEASAIWGDPEEIARVTRPISELKE